MQRTDKRPFAGRSALLAALLLAMTAPACDGSDPGPRDSSTAATPSTDSGGSSNESGTSSTPPEGGAGDSEAGAPAVMPSGGSNKGGSNSGGNGGSHSGGGGKGGSNNGGFGGSHAGTNAGGGGQMSGGTAGTAGTGMTDMLKVCDACETKCKRWVLVEDGSALGFGTDYCLHGPGVAQAGPAKSVEISVLCGELLDCMVRSDCYKKDMGDCYCGTSGVACQTGGANGVCLDEFEAAAESDQYGDIGARFADPTFALGRADYVMECYRAECPQECGLDPAM